MSGFFTLSVFFDGGGKITEIVGAGWLCSLKKRNNITTLSNKVYFPIGKLGKMPIFDAPQR